MIILVFALLILTTLILRSCFRKKLKDWTENYKSNSQYYELKIDKRICTVKTEKLYGKMKTPKGADDTLLYKNSILFYEKEYGKYFSIESYSQKDTFLSLFKKYRDKYKVPDVFSLDLAGERISAWVNTDDLDSDILGTEKNPIRIFKLKYNSNEYLTNEYSASIKRYRTDFRYNQTLLLLFLIIYILTLICVGVFFNVINYLCSYFC